MKTKWIGILAFVWTASLVVTAASSVVRAGASHEIRLGSALGALHTATVTIPGSASSATRLPPSGSGATSSMLLVNTSATCVQVGGSDVTSTTGAAVGLGCAAGQTFPFDGKEMYGVSSAVGTVSVQVLFAGQ